MKSILARTLSRKQIVTNDGKAIGTLRNLMVDFDTGLITDLVLEPDQSFDTTGYTLDGDRMLIPFESVRDIKDFIVVDRYLARM
ncbi:MAG TPA: PRC-barrel domain-containing protein [Methanospirillum sp.]|uniref:PRC-barrel domain-containing protein n=1 Tax=Methanospirillum sp. TaxID=45200 RepID=UPI002C502F06|nr:PRC-barrel domain-containing protein [Methanospirillum sp.]HOJ96680.1 PRC-barrel domain-containing protein [Methanospirillum sp.]HOL41004.1 PRC-barrel domain-containing protein [Methanospirillum sp.]HPP78165.1 PRC-barrel domain-containing protein [Methanospirillum sp.]